MSTNYEKLIRCSQKQIDIFIHSLVSKEASRYVDWSAWLSAEDPEAPMLGEEAFLMENGDECGCRFLEEFEENGRTRRRVYLFREDGTVRDEAFPIHMVRLASEEYYHQPEEPEEEEAPDFSIDDIFREIDKTVTEEAEPEEAEPVTEPAEEPAEEVKEEEAPVEEIKEEEVPVEEEAPAEEEDVPVELPKPETSVPEIEKTRIYVPGERLFMDEEDIAAEEEAAAEQETPAPAEEPVVEEEPVREEELPVFEKEDDEPAFAPIEEPAPAEIRNDELILPPSTKETSADEQRTEDFDTTSLRNLLNEAASETADGMEDLLSAEDTAHIMAIEDELMRSFDESEGKEPNEDTISSSEISSLLEDLKERSDLYDPEDPEDRELPTIAFTSMVDDKTRF